MFRFKQFSVDQTGCAMKINTDGVLLGALTAADNPKTILDIGTGTGVIALMLAQRFSSAKVNAIEIDSQAAQTAGRNFENSPFVKQLSILPVDFQNYFKNSPAHQYDLILSNPPFHINSLESPEANKRIAKHADNLFFEKLISDIAGHLSETGACWLILPSQAAALVRELAVKHKLNLHKTIAVYSFKDSIPHREVLSFGKVFKELISDKFVIYAEPKIYSEMYKRALKEYLTIF